MAQQRCLGYHNHGVLEGRLGLQQLSNGIHPWPLRQASLEELYWSATYDYACCGGCDLLADRVDYMPRPSGLFAEGGENRGNEGHESSRSLVGNFNSFVGDDLKDEIEKNLILDGNIEYELPDSVWHSELCGMSTEGDTLIDACNWEGISPDLDLSTETAPTCTVASSDTAAVEMSPFTDRSTEPHPGVKDSHKDELTIITSTTTSSDLQFCCDFAGCEKSFTHRHKLKYDSTSRIHIFI